MDEAESLNERANALAAARNFDAAVPLYERALQLCPQDRAYRTNLAGALQRAGRHEQAEHLALEAIDAHPTDAAGYYVLGLVRHSIGDYDGAERRLRQAIALSADEAYAHFALSQVLLTRGQFAEGWREYEWRWREKGMRPPTSKTRPAWDGSPLDGKTILLMSEQGFGDTLQFVRYAPVLRALKGAGRVVVMCERPLVPVLTKAAGVDEVAEKVQGVRPPHFDTLCSIGSLPLLLRTELETIPRNVPYLWPDADRVALWRERLKLTGDVLNIGLVWAGRPEHGNDRNRSCRFEDFSQLVTVSGVRLFSLQSGPAREQMKHPAVTDAGAGFSDFADTAAVASQLDLLITVDTAPAHLAGAMGRPVWTLLPYVADFRWLLDRSDSPWYPTMRLFRQPRPGDWAGVISRVADELARPGESSARRPMS